MKRIFLLGIGLIISITLLFATEGSYKEDWSSMASPADSLPDVLGDNRSDLIESNLRNEAKLKFATHQLPASLEEWEAARKILREKIIKKSRLHVDHDLPLDMRETGTVQMEGYVIKNIFFQTRPGVYATANLYIPEGKGPFPAVVNMIGHWRKGKIDTSGPQHIGHSLALNGYVCLSIDPWGSGERTTTHGDFEYHGANLGASLMNIGETLLGVQVSDNMRGVDLLTSLPYVDAEKIGATGASGGGNQTMWFAALDERVKAALPIVSVGTFESAVMRSNCVCELLPDGLTFTETSGVLALFAPRALKMCNHHQDSNPTFYPAEMLRSFHNAKPIFDLYGVENHISYELFDLTHGYWEEDREVMLGWFDLHLKEKGTGASRKEIPFELLPEEQLMVFEEGKRDPLVKSTDEYSRIRGEELRREYLNQKNFDKEQKKVELRNMLQIDEDAELLKVHEFTSKEGWDRMALETSDHKLIPLLHQAPKNNTEGYTLISNTKGKHGIPSSLLEELQQKGSGIVIVELSGTGEAASPVDTATTRLSQFHTLSRADLWLGKTILGEWAKEISLVSKFIEDTYQPQRLTMDGSKEAGLAALFLCAIEEGNIDELTVRKAPASYLFDTREDIDFFSMGIHLPGFLNWGDISLATALAGKEITFIHPVTMSGNSINESALQEYQAEFEKIRRLCNQTGKISFIP
ncbi:MAG: acetylxylan esterase [Anditalea sp.]